MHRRVRLAEYDVVKGFCFSVLISVCFWLFLQCNVHRVILAPMAFYLLSWLDKFQNYSYHPKFSGRMEAFD